MQDLGNADLSKEMYLVAHVMRLGKMLYSESSKKVSGLSLPTSNSSPSNSSHLFRRPFGVAVLNISDLLITGYNQVMNPGGSLSNAGGPAGQVGNANTLLANNWTSMSATLGAEREYTFKVRNVTVFAFKSRAPSFIFLFSITSVSFPAEELLLLSITSVSFSVENLLLLSITSVSFSAEKLRSLQPKGSTLM